MLERIDNLSLAKRRLLRDLALARLNRAASEAEQLVAYVVLDAAQAGSTDTLRAALRDALPDYMQPATFVVLDELPRTANGKLDRNALPDPVRHGDSGDDAFVSPRTDAEKSLARIWVEVLGVESIGVHDNFFELGGHSLLVNQVVARIRDVFDVDLPLRSLFDTPTLVQLAAAVEDALIAELAALPERPVESSPGDG